MSAYYYNPDTQEKIPSWKLKKKYNVSLPADTETFQGWYLLHTQTVPETPCGKRLVEGDIALIEGKYWLTYTFEDIPLALLKRENLSQINAAFEAAMRRLTMHYPDAENQTFHRQLAEAETFTAHSDAQVPFLEALAKARGMTVKDVAEGILENALAYAAAAGELVGKRHALKGRLETCSSVEEVQSLTIDITLLAETR